jgi:hypothetical protein
MVDVVPRTPQSILREWVQREINGVSRVALGDLLPLARQRFAKDKEFQQAVVNYSLPGLVEDALRQAMHGNRRFTRTGFSYTTPEEVDNLVKNKLAHWLENSSSSVHAPILRMVRPELDYAIEQRRKRATSELQVASFMQELRDGLPDDTTQPIDFYSKEDLARIYTKHFSREEQNGD